MKLITVDLFRKLIALVRIKISLLLLFGLIFLTNDLFAQSIGTVTVSPTTVCAGSNVSLSFLVTNTSNPSTNYFTASTTYIAYLSSSTGGAPWTQIFSGTSSSTPPASSKDASATISLTVTIPSTTTPSGVGYRISVGSTSPSFIGSGGANASIGFTINVPTLTGASQLATVCPGSGAVINLTGLIASSTSTVNYSINGVAQTAITGVAANGSGAASFTSANLIAANNGQTLQITGITTTIPATNCTKTFTQNVTLSVNPSPTLSGASQSASVCAGSGAIINLSGLLASTTSTVNYTINGVAQTPVTGVLSNGSGAASFTSATLTAANNGQTLQITGITKTSGAAPNCSASFTQDVILTVNDLPTITLAPSATSVCFSSGAQTTPLAYSATSGTPTSYSITWSGSPSNSFATVTDAAWTVSPFTINVPAGTLAGTYTGNLTVKNANGCISSPASTFTVAVNALPTPTFSPPPGAFACVNTNVTYTTQSGGGITNYVWSVPGTAGLDYDITGGGISNIDNTVTLQWKIAGGTRTVTINYTNSNGCTAVTATSSTATTINAATPVTPGSISGTASQCSGLTLQGYSITAVPDAATYTWTVPTGWSITGGAGTNSILVTTGSAGNNGDITVTAGNACGTSAASTFAVIVNPGTPAAPGAIAGTTLQCPTLTAQVYSVTDVLGVTYTWTVPVGWSITGGTGTNSITVTTGIFGQNGDITVTAGNPCGTSAASTLAVTVQDTPATPGAISGIASQCPGLTLQAYSITPVASATTYTWTVPAGWSVTGGAGTNSITVTTGSAGDNGNITVTAGNSCGTSAANTLAVTVNPGTPATPGAITGTTPQCPGLTLQAYSITPVPNATTYTWAVPTGWSITGGAGTANITVTTGSAGQNGNITVTAGNSCGTSAAGTLAVTVNPGTPATPGVISGTTLQCPGLTLQAYSITAVPNATTYTWAVPTGWSITGGAGTSSITVTTGSTGQNGNITVTAGNSCGTSALRTLAVTVQGIPATPGAIAGTASQCPALTGQVYSITAVASATSYTWTVPTGWSVTAGAATNSITVTTGGAGQNGNITVTATNSCGTSAANSLAVIVNPLPTLFTVSGGGTRCTADVTTFAIDLSGSETGVNYQLLRDGVFVETKAGTGAIINFTAQTTAATYTVRATNATTSCTTLMTGSAIVSVNAVTSGIPSNPAAVCLNGTALLSPTDATGSGTITYQWQSSTTGLNGSFSNIPFATDASYSTPPVSAIKYYVRVATSTLNGVPCSATTSVITVTTTGVLNTLITDGSDNDWKNPLSWLNSQVPTIDQGTLGCPVTVKDNLVLDNTFSGTTNLQIQRGVVLIDASVTDIGDANLLLMSKPGSNEAESVLDIKSGTTTFLGGASITSATLIVRTGATLILGQQTNCKCIDIFGYPGANNTLPLCSNLNPPSPLNNPTVPTGNMLFIGNKSKIIVENGGFIIVNGNVENRSNAGNILINGYLYISGNYQSFTGNVSVTQDNFGVGDMYACGIMNSNGASTILGTAIDCTDSAVPCVATNLLCSARVNISPYGEVGWCNGTVINATLINAAPVDLLTWESSTNLTTWTSAGNDGKTVYQWGAGALPEVIANPVTPTYYRAKITKVPNPPLVLVGCSSLSFISYVIPGQNRWRGIEEVPLLQTPLKPDDWNNIANWCAYIPNSTSPLTRINTGNPTIYGTDVANVNSIELFPGTSIKLNGTSPSLNIYGNLINNGEIADILESGTVNFKGNSTMTGSGLYQLNNLTVDLGFTVSFPVNPSEIEISGDIDFDGVAQFIEGGSEITLTGGQDQTINMGGNPIWNFNLFKSSNKTVDLTGPFNLFGRMEMFNAATVNSNGNLLIRSRGVSTSMDGSIGIIPAGGSVNGNVTVERWMDPITGEPYRYIASPVAGGYIASAVDRLYKYSPVTGWAKNYNPMQIGDGFAALTWNTSAQITWSVTGETDWNDFTWNFPTEGWYLIGNPYPSAISWTLAFNAAWSRANISPTIAITDNHEVNYPTYFRYFNYNGVVPTTWGYTDITNGVIAMGQSFWVYALAASSALTVQQTAKTNDQGSSFYRTSETPKYDQLVVNLNSGSMADQTFLRLHEKATEGFDFNHDLPKLWNDKMDVFLMSGSNREMLMHTLKEIPSDVKIPVGVKVTEPGEYHISFGGSGESSNLSELYLIDTYEGVAIPVSTTEPYSFMVKDASKTITDRFYLSLSADLELNKETSISVYPNPVNNLLNIQIEGSRESATSILIDVNGKMLESSDFKGFGTIDMASYPEGMYILKVKTANGMVTKKIVKYN